MFARGRYRRNLADAWRGSLLSAACKVSGCCTCKARRTKSPAADTWEFLRKLQVIRFYLVHECLDSRLTIKPSAVDEHFSALLGAHTYKKYKLGRFCTSIACMKFSVFFPHSRVSLHQDHWIHRWCRNVIDSQAKVAAEDDASQRQAEGDNG